MIKFYVGIFCLFSFVSCEANEGKAIPKRVSWGSRIDTFEFEGHKFIVIKAGLVVYCFKHHPDCKCRNESNYL